MCDAAATEVNVHLGDLTLNQVSSPIYLSYISPISPLYLPYISHISPQHHMTLLEAAIASHPDLLEATGGGVGSGHDAGVSSGDGGGGGGKQQARFRCVEVHRSEHRRTLRLLGPELEIEIWSPTPPAWAARHPAHSAHATHLAAAAAASAAAAVVAGVGNLTGAGAVTLILTPP